MKALWSVALIAAATVAAPAYAACTYPSTPEKIPDGNSATLDEMLSAKKAVEKYNQDMTSYLSCIDLEASAQIPADKTKLSAEDKKKYDDLAKMQAQKHNAAVDELEAMAARLNEQIRIFKAKSAGAKKG
jgi:hypothetical protein